MPVCLLLIGCTPRVIKVPASCGRTSDDEPALMDRFWSCCVRLSLAALATYEGNLLPARRALGTFANSGTGWEKCYLT